MHEKYVFVEPYLYQRVPQQYYANTTQRSSKSLAGRHRALFDVLDLQERALCF